MTIKATTLGRTQMQCHQCLNDTDGSIRSSPICLSNSYLFFFHHVVTKWPASILINPLPFPVPSLAQTLTLTMSQFLLMLLRARALAQHSPPEELSPESSQTTKHRGAARSPRARRSLFSSGLRLSQSLNFDAAAPAQGACRQSLGDTLSPKSNQS